MSPATRQSRLVSQVMESAILASTNGIMIVEAGPQSLTTVFVNPAYESITGFSSAETVGRPPGRLHRGDADQEGLTVMRQAIANQRPARALLRNYRKDGTLFWNELSISPVHDAAGRLTHFVGILNDITERKRAEAELAASAMRLEAITAMSSEGLVTFDDAGVLSYVNEAFIRLTGRTAAQFDGADCAAFDRLLAGQCDPRHAFDGVAKLYSGLGEPGDFTPADAEICLLAPHNRVLVRTAKRGSHGTSLLLYYRDVTKARELEEIKSEFLATAAHELRTPITSVLGYAELLMARDFDATQSRELYEIIHRQAQRVAGLLDELLDLARIEARRRKDFDVATQDLRQIVTAVVGAIDGAAGRTVVAMPDEPQWVDADPARLRQALHNVLNNALKFSAAEAPVTVSLCSKSESTRVMLGVAVEDRGIGMSREDAGRVGERFFRADTSGNVPGTGLGVSIAKEILSLHGGALEVASELGKGSCFTLWLPQAPFEAGGQAAPTDAAEADGPAIGFRMNYRRTAT